MNQVHWENLMKSLCNIYYISPINHLSLSGSGILLDTMTNVSILTENFGGNYNHPGFSLKPGEQYLKTLIF